MEISTPVLAYPWVATDAGRSTSRRPKQSNDCTVRALALARGITYDVAYDELKSAGRSSGKRFLFAEWLQTQPWAHKISFPAIKGERRMNPVDFTKLNRTGIFICKTAKHVFVVIDGVVHDEFAPRSNRCIYSSWRVE